MPGCYDWRYGPQCRKQRPAMRKFLTKSFLITQLPVVAALLGIAFLNWTYGRSLAETREAVAHSLRVTGAIHGVLSQVQDIEVGQRGYLLTRDADYLEPYERSRAEVSATLTGLRTLVADNAMQTGHVAAMEGLVRDKLAEIDSTLQLARAGQQAQAVAEVKSDRGKVIMDDLRGLVEQMRGAENALLTQRTDAMRRTEGWALLMVLAGLALTVAARIVSGVLAARLAKPD